jgi:hypothetical protein
VPERLELLRREVRRATRRTNSWLSGRIPLSLAIVLVGGVSSFLVSLVNEGRIRVAWTILGGVVVPLFFGLALLIIFFIQYRRSGFRDAEWQACHDVSGENGELFLHLSRKAGLDTGLAIELWVKRHGEWTVVHNGNRFLRPLPGNRVLSCRFDLEHQVYPGGFYEIRWFRDDRGKFVEITRETFQLRNYRIGPLSSHETAGECISSLIEPVFDTVGSVHP